MTTNKAKEEACMAYSDYLELIYCFGKGVMLTIHIQQYMERIAGVNKLQVWRVLRELQKKEIIDIHKLHNNNYIKLKKFAFKFLLNKDSSQHTKSLSYNFKAIIKSIYINEFILKKYKLKKSTITELSTNLFNNSTLIYKNKMNSHILCRFKDDNVDIQEEIKNLDSLAAQQLYNLQTTTTADKNVKKLNKFNLNNMQSRNIYISKISEDTVNVAFMDISDTYTAKKMADNFELVYLYLSTLFKDKKFIFYVVVSDLENKKRIEKQKQKLEQMLQNKHLISFFSIKVIDLDLRAKAFSNIKILL